MTTAHFPDVSQVALNDLGPGANATSGNPRISGKVLAQNPDGSSECGLWSCTPGTRKVTFPTDEFCVFQSGRGAYISDASEEIEVRAGTAVFFPAGWTGRSVITETLTKAYMCR